MGICSGGGDRDTQSSTEVELPHQVCEASSGSVLDTDASTSGTWDARAMPRLPT